MGKHSQTKNPSRAALRAASVVVAGAISAAAVGAPAPAEAATGANWGPIVECESGGKNVYNYMYEQNPSYYTASGYFQIVNSTWLANGGGEFAPTAIQATYEQQKTVADRIYAKSGYTPWNSSKGCWGPKIGTKSTPDVVEATRPATSTTGKHRLKPAPSIASYQALPAVKPKPVVPAGAQFTPGGQGPYEVRAGDTLSALAVANGTTVAKLVELNDQIVEHEDWIFTGEKLFTH